MSIINDFFFLAWQREPVCLGVVVDDGQIFSDMLDADHELFCDCTAIILIASQSSFAELSKLTEPLQAIRYFATGNSWEITTIQDTQCKLLLFLDERGDMSLNKQIGKRLDRIRKHGVVGYETSRKLISLLTLIPQRATPSRTAVSRATVSSTLSTDTQPTIAKDNSYYQRGQLLILEMIDRLQGSIESRELLHTLEQIPARLQDQKFSIGITGVINAGKSTMLNALLGSEILGTSIVPETANLTIIRYAKEPRASVNFWDSAEWSAIEQSATSIESMREFVDDAVSAAGEDLSRYISLDGTTIDIDIEELPSYTSAKDSDSRCNLVKSVELYTDMEFVRDGVEIVDTPGLDDPIIHREAITKEYIYSCDLLCHLMSVSQSATQKDIEFITDTLLHHSVAELLIVITRIDSVDEHELAEVIAYTKSSIIERLKSTNQSVASRSIIERIHFIPIAGKMALLHRTHRAKEALSAGYDLQRSGILELESYLGEVLFGDGSRKARLIIDSTHIEILHVIEAQLLSYSDEYSLLGKDHDQIAHEYESYQEQILQTREEMARLQHQISHGRDDLHSYCDTLESVVATQMKSLQDRLKRRIYDDVSYELRKNNKKPTQSRIASMIQRAISDGFVDILRDYRYQFTKRVEETLERIDRDSASFHIDTHDTIINAKEFFEQHFSTTSLNSSLKPMIDDINQIIASHSQKEMPELDIALLGRFEIAIDELYGRFAQRSGELRETLLADFALRCQDPLDRVELEISSRISLLQEASRRANDHTFDAKARAKTIDTKTATLHSIKLEIEAEQSA